MPVGGGVSWGGGAPASSDPRWNSLAGLPTLLRIGSRRLSALSWSDELPAASSVTPREAMEDDSDWCGGAGGELGLDLGCHGCCCHWRSCSSKVAIIGFCREEVGGTVDTLRVCGAEMKGGTCRTGGYGRSRGELSCPALRTSASRLTGLELTGWVSCAQRSLGAGSNSAIWEIRKARIT